MDTFSGLNQGRMNMEFCTQFWSEYASLPTAFSWVATGAVVSVQGESGYDWAADAIPICLLMAATWQFLGTTYGGYKLLKANTDEKFWKNKEKWETVQFFSKQGVKATKLGWQEDCFCLAKENMGIKPLFDRIEPIHNEYIRKVLSKTVASVKSSKVEQKKYNWSRLKAREEHWALLDEKYFVEKKDEESKVRLRDNNELKEWFVTFSPPEDSKNQDLWMKTELFHKISLQMLFVVVAVVTGIYCYLSIAQNIETRVAVQEGLSVLNPVSGLNWCVFALYNIVLLIYYGSSFWGSISSGWHYTLSALRCTCFRASDNNSLETAFNPMWVTNTGQDLPRSTEM